MRQKYIAPGEGGDIKKGEAGRIRRVAKTDAKQDVLAAVRDSLKPPHNVMQDTVSDLLTNMPEKI